MKNGLKITLLATCFLLLLPMVSAASRLKVQLTAFNITQNQDAVTIANRPGDVIRYTADVRNQGPDDLVDYEMKIYIKDILQYGSIIDLGGGVIEGDYIKYPPILQAVGCGCSNANYFKVKLKENVCEVTKLSARYEDVTTTIPLACEVPPPPPEVPTKTGPAFMFVLFATIALSGAYILRFKKAPVR